MKVAIDPYFNDIPWEIIFDDLGRVIGEIYLIRGGVIDDKDRRGHKWGKRHGKRKL